MKTFNSFMSIRTVSTLGALSILAACASTPKDTEQVAAARRAIASAEQNPAVAQYAAVDLDKAREQLSDADKAATAHKPAMVSNHYAYLSEQTALTAIERAKVKTAEARIAQGESERNKIQLAAREREVGQARSAAEMAQARAAQSDAKAAQSDAKAAQSDARAAQSEAKSEQLSEEAARLAQQIADLQAKQTPRGLVLTLGDVLFDTGKAQLKPGAERSLDRLVQFLNTHTERKVLIEGFTDSVGSDDYNMGLSERRASAVRDALSGRGIDSGRIATRGYGKAYPVASNADAGGRQQNRRVEVIISNDAGEIPSR